MQPLPDGWMQLATAHPTISVATCEDDALDLQVSCSAARSSAWAARWHKQEHHLLGSGSDDILMRAHRHRATTVRASPS